MCADKRAGARPSRQDVVSRVKKLIRIDRDINVLLHYSFIPWIKYNIC